jgi:hypothetical protein
MVSVSEIQILSVFVSEWSKEFLSLSQTLSVFLFLSECPILSVSLFETRLWFEKGCLFVKRCLFGKTS